MGTSTISLNGAVHVAIEEGGVNIQMLIVKARNPSSRPHRSPPGNSQTNPHLGANPELFFSKIKARLSGLLKCLVNKCGKCSTSFTHKNIEEPVVCVEGFGSDPPITYPHS